MKIYTIPEYGITVEVNEETKAGNITSQLKEQFLDEEEDGAVMRQFVDNERAEASADALEALILAHACAGIDISSAAYQEGLKTAVEAIANNL